MEARDRVPLMYDRFLFLFQNKWSKW